MINLPKINNWAVIMKVASPYRPPEMGVPALSGDVENHPRLGNRKNQITSQIKWLDPINWTCTTENTIYELGEVSEQFVEHIKDKFNMNLLEYLEPLIKKVP